MSVKHRGISKVVFEDIFITIHDVDGKENSQMLRKSVEMPLKDQIKSEVKKHKKYSRMSSWGGVSTSSARSQNSFDKTIPFAPPKTITAHRKTPSQISVLLEFARSNENEGDIFGKDNTSLFGKDDTSLLKTPHGNYGTAIPDFTQNKTETEKKSTRIMSYQNRLKPQQSMESLSDNSAESSKSKEFASSVHGEDSDLLQGDKFLPENTSKDPLFSPLSLISHGEPTLQNETYGSKDFDSSYDESLPSFDEEFTGQNIRSSIFAGLRNRLDTDASIEVFGVDEKVKLDPESNSLLVKSKNTEEVLEP